MLTIFSNQTKHALQYFVASQKQILKHFVNKNTQINLHEEIALL